MNCVGNLLQLDVLGNCKNNICPHSSDSLIAKGDLQFPFMVLSWGPWIMAETVMIVVLE